MTVIMQISEDIRDMTKDHNLKLTHGTIYNRSIEMMGRVTSKLPSIPRVPSFTRVSNLNM